MRTTPSFALAMLLVDFVGVVRGFCCLTYDLKGRQRQLAPSSLRTLDATSEVPVPLSQTEVRQPKRNTDVTSDSLFELQFLPLGWC